MNFTPPPDTVPLPPRREHQFADDLRDERRIVRGLSGVEGHGGEDEETGRRGEGETEGGVSDGSADVQDGSTGVGDGSFRVGDGTVSVAHGDVSVWDGVRSVRDAVRPVRNADGPLWKGAFPVWNASSTAALSASLRVAEMRLSLGMTL
jgi:hypothetical protein